MGMQRVGNDWVTELNWTDFFRIEDGQQEDSLWGTTAWKEKKTHPSPSAFPRGASNTTLVTEWCHSRCFSHQRDKVCMSISSLADYVSSYQQVHLVILLRHFQIRKMRISPFSQKYYCYELTPKNFMMLVLKPLALRAGVSMAGWHSYAKS